MNKGLFSIEALAAFMVLLLILISIPINEKPSYERIIAKHKLSDFLIVSSITESNKEELEKDALLFFGKNNFLIKERFSGKEHISKSIKFDLKGRNLTVAVSLE